MNPIRNTHGRTRNWDDSGVFQDSRGANKEYNPVFKVDLLGSIIPQGLIGYITMVRLRSSESVVVDQYTCLGCECKCQVSGRRVSSRVEPVVRERPRCVNDVNITKFFYDDHLFLFLENHSSVALQRSNHIKAIQ